jgi:hypothetical protein
MRKSRLLFILVLIVGIMQISVGLESQTKEDDKGDVKTGILPKILSPEESLKTFLNAFASKDIDTVMAYIPNGTGKEITEWRERIKLLFQSRMSERKHIKAVESITLIKIETGKTGKLATMEATIVTTPNFSNAVTCDENGKCTATYKWLFRQAKEDGPWLHDGGGF